MPFPSFIAVTPIAYSVSNNVSVALPASGILGGDLLFIWVANGGIVTPSGWTRLDPPAYDTAVFVKEANGTENGTSVTVTSTSTASFYRCAFQIRNARFPEANTYKAGSLDQINPPSLTHSRGSADYLWVVGGGHSLPSNATAPTNYTLQSGNTRGGVATRALNAATEDPGAFGPTENPAVTGSFTIAVAYKPSANNLFFGSNF